MKEFISYNLRIKTSEENKKTGAQPWQYSGVPESIYTSFPITLVARVRRFCTASGIHLTVQPVAFPGDYSFFNCFIYYKVINMNTYIEFGFCPPPSSHFKLVYFSLVY